MMWQLNPLVNHRIYIEPDATDEEIMDQAETLLKQYADQHAKGEKKRYVANPVFQRTVATAQRLSACNNKVQSLKEIVLERKIKG